PSRTVPCALAVSLMLLSLAPATAAAAAAPAAGTLPAGFWGVNWDKEISFHSSPDEREANWQAMADIGVQSARSTFLWSGAQSYWNSPYDFTATDAVVRLAVEHN